MIPPDEIVDVSEPKPIFVCLRELTRIPRKARIGNEHSPGHSGQLHRAEEIPNRLDNCTPMAPRMTLDLNSQQLWKWVRGP